MSPNPRLIVLQGLIQVVEGRSLNAVIPSFTQLEPNDRALSNELIFGTLHHYFELKAYAQKMLTKPLKRSDTDVLLCIQLGIYQMLYTRIPDHAVIHETVALCGLLKKDWAKSIVNAILRRVQRSDTFQQDIKISGPNQFNLPNWLFDQIKEDWGTELDWLPHLHNKAPLTLRVNSAKTTSKDYLKILNNADIEAELCADTNSAIHLTKPAEISALPGYQEGLFSVQDGAAQWAAEILAPENGDKILDACAAPGGKTAHILELMDNDCELVALDNQAERLERVKENLARLQLSADIRCGDAVNPSDWLLSDTETFDRILCDAPCSATGIIRRHPDICLHRTVKDVKRLNQLQWRILKSLWQLLKPGGTFVYSTCSILKSENETMINDFVKQNPDAQLSSFDIVGNKKADKGIWQIFPGQNQMDGFFYAKLLKNEAN